MTRSPSPQPTPDSPGLPPKGRTLPRFLRPATSFAYLRRLRRSHKMWDVVWTDPKRESRKEHRERKARQPRSDKSSTKARSLFSRGSTSSSDGPSFVGYPGRKTSSRDFATLSPTPSSIHTTTSTNNYDIEADRASNFTLNNYETTSDTVSHSFESTTDHTLVHEQILECSSELYNTNSRGDDDQYPLPPSPPWDTQVIERVALEPCHIVQTFSEGSYIARSTEVTTSLRTPSDPQFVSQSPTVLGWPDFILAGAQEQVPKRTSTTSAQYTKTSAVMQCLVEE
ncbi:hypothetical protein NCS55_01380000 [Fusarium keratoplasticum]|nr:hypothetical protein NCS55_01380000 [Fusarium keratoplasticum]